MAYRNRFPFVDVDLDKKLQDAGFSVAASGRAVLRLSADGQESVALRWTSEGGAEIYYDPARGFLSAEGNVPTAVAESFKKLVSVAQTLLGQNWSGETKWAELYSNVRILSDKQPLDAYAATYSPKVVERMSGILGLPVKPFLFAVFSSHGGEAGQPLNEVPDWVNIIIEPFIPNPKYYFMKLVFRQQEVSKVVTFASKYEPIVEDVISGIEGR